MKSMSSAAKFRRIWLPQILLVSLLVSYLFFCALIFRHFDPELAKVPFTDVVHFEFVTLTTIGYGNICPSNKESKIFSICFSVIGIPMTLLILANLGKFVSKAYWYIMKGFGNKSAPAKIARDADMPLMVILALYALTCLFGSLTLSHNGKRFTIDDIYFSFISFATVGFGDKYPETNTISKLVITLLYLTWGIMLSTAMFVKLNQWMKKVHYFGRRFTGARDVPVHLAGQTISVSQLIETVGNKFHASPKEIYSMLHELDDLISETVKRKETQMGRIAPLASQEDFNI